MKLIEAICWRLDRAANRLTIFTGRLAAKATKRRMSREDGNARL
jgi:hypothetical protein